MDADKRYDGSHSPSKNSSAALNTVIAALGVAIAGHVIRDNSSSKPQEGGSTLTHVNLDAPRRDQRFTIPQPNVGDSTSQQALPEAPQALSPDGGQSQAPPIADISAHQSAEQIAPDNATPLSSPESTFITQQTSQPNNEVTPPSYPTEVPFVTLDFSHSDRTREPTSPPYRPTVRPEATATTASQSENLTIETMTPEERIEILKKELNITIKTAGEYYSSEQREDLELFGVDLEASPNDEVLMDLIAKTLLSMHEDVQNELKNGPRIIVIERVRQDMHADAAGKELSSYFYLSEDGTFVLQVDDGEGAFASNGDEDRLPSGLKRTIEAQLVIYDGSLDFYFNTAAGQQLLADYLRDNDNFYDDSDGVTKYIALYRALRFSDTDTYIPLERLAARLTSLRKIADENHFDLAEETGLKTLTLPIY